MNWEVIISAFFGVLGVAIGALITSASNRHKTKAEAIKTTAESVKTEAEANEQIRKTVMELIKPLQKRIEDLEQELADALNWAHRLVVQVKGMGCEPVPFVSSKKEQT